MILSEQPHHEHPPAHRYTEAEKAKKASEAKQAQGGPWLAFSVKECLELPLALLHYWPFTTWL